MTFVSVVLFLAGSAWFIELGGLEREQIQSLNENVAFKRIRLNTTDYLGHHVVRFKVDIPNSNSAPPIAAVVPLLDAFSTMGFSLVSHNDESRPNKDMIYLTWMLQKEHVTFPTVTESNSED